MECNSSNPIPSHEIQFLQRLQELNSQNTKIHFIGTCQISSNSGKKTGKDFSTTNLINTINRINRFIEDALKSTDNTKELAKSKEILSLLTNLKQVALIKLERKREKGNSLVPKLELAIAQLADKILESEKILSVQEASNPHLPYQSNVLNLVHSEVTELERLNHDLMDINNSIIAKFLNEVEGEDQPERTQNGYAVLSKEELNSVQALISDIIKLKSLNTELIKSNEGKRVFLNKINLVILNLTIIHNEYYLANRWGKMHLITAMIENLQNLASSIVSFDATHPLYDIESSILQEVKRQPMRHCGAHYTGFGGEHVKGGHLHADIRQVDGKETILLEFKLTYFTRNHLSWILNFLISNREFKERDENSSLITNQINVNIIFSNDKEFKYFYNKDEKGQYSSNGGYTPKPRHSTKDARFAIIEFGNLGKISFCVDPNTGTLYDRVKIELNKDNLKEGNGLNEIAKMLSTLGLGTVLIPQSQDDEIRIKIFTILELFHPLEAIPFYTTETYHQMSIEELKKVIIETFPDMQHHFGEYLKENGMKKIELFPGKTTWAISNLVPLLRQKGAWGLTCGLTGKGKTDIGEAAKTIALIIKTQLGMLSSENRFGFGSYIKGASANADFGQRGAPFTFWRLVNEQPSTHTPNSFPFADYFSSVYFIVSLNPLQNGQVCLKDDCYGNTNLHGNLRAYTDPKFRGNLIEDCGKIDSNWEILVKDRVPPQHIVGLLVSTKEDKEQLIQALTELEVIKEGKVQIAPDIEVPIDDFVHVGQDLTKEMFKH